MENQLIIRVLAILIVVVFSSCNTGKNKKIEGNTENITNTSEPKSIEKKKYEFDFSELDENYTKVNNTGLENKKFYKLSKNKQGEYFLKRYPNDFDMGKNVFNDNVFVDGVNTMEPYPYKILQKNKKDSLIRIVIELQLNNTVKDTLVFKHDPKKGFLYKYYNKKWASAFIDSLYIKNVEIKDEIITNN